MRRALLPLAIFLILAGFLAIGLNRDPREVPSPLVDKPAPMFSLPQLADATAKLSPADLRGQVWLFNVWASWCVACRIEHPLLVDLARQGTVPLIGLNYKDQRADALAWLKQHGDPYKLSVADIEGLVGIDYGVYGVPETFVIDKYGVIRHKHIGPVTPEALRDEILPLVAKLEKEGA
jgi:cytochrome c biogenesis protein CcmG/thiol:disulfide interchange protein DsbE